jgi:hypothetical protein
MTHDAAERRSITFRLLANCVRGSDHTASHIRSVGREKGTRVGLLGVTSAAGYARQVTAMRQIVNLKTAKALGITLPTPVLARADQRVQ